MHYFQADKWNPAHFYLRDIYYDGQRFHVWEPGPSRESPNERETYGYLVRFERSAGGPSSLLDSIIEYTLVDDPTLTRRDFSSPSSSSAPVKPPPKHITIFSDFIYK